MIIVLYFLILKKRNIIIYCCLHIIKVNWNIFSGMSCVLVGLRMRTSKSFLGFFSLKWAFKKLINRNQHRSEEANDKNWSRDGFSQQFTSFLSLFVTSRNVVLQKDQEISYYRAGIWTSEFSSTTGQSTCICILKICCS